VATRLCADTAVVFEAQCLTPTTRRLHPMALQSVMLTAAGTIASRTRIALIAPARVRARRRMADADTVQPTRMTMGH